MNEYIVVLEKYGEALITWGNFWNKEAAQEFLDYISDPIVASFYDSGAQLSICALEDFYKTFHIM